MGAPIVGAGQRPEPLLARGVPNRRLHAPAAGVHHLDLKVHADRRLQVVVEGVVRESQQDRTLPDARIADQQ